MVFRIIFMLIFILLLDFYVFRGIRGIFGSTSKTTSFVFNFIFWSIPAILIIGMAVFIFFRNQLIQPENFRHVYWLTGFFILFYLPKTVILFFVLSEDITRLLAYTIRLPFGSDSVVYQTMTAVRNSHLLTSIGIFLAVIPFIGTIYGIASGKFNFKLREQSVFFKHLPSSFEGFKIVQISDLHVGSLSPKHKVEIERAVNLINAQKPDVIFFTGDIVNNTATELDPWIDVLKKMEARYGKFSILGNHDYGDYVQWESSKHKQANLESLADKHRLMGFKILLNEADSLTLGNEKIAIIGVENWGLPPFPQFGNLKTAMAGVDSIPFKILLSHDPSHWDAQVAGKTDIALTLSGHTHGMQIGVEIGKFRWSPIKWRYKRWGGLYQHNEQFLYVNIGLGFIGFSGRIGTPPEIAVITLHKMKTD